MYRTDNQLGSLAILVCLCFFFDFVLGIDAIQSVRKDVLAAIAKEQSVPCEKNPECLLLASMAYSEAQGEDLNGMISVVQTVYHRIDHGGFEKTVAEVVAKGQYSTIPSVKKDPIEAYKALLAAELVMEGKVEDLVDGATHFYAYKKRGKPASWKDLVFVKKAYGHAFYRQKEKKQ